MEISGIESSSLSEESKKALQSETWQNATEEMGLEARKFTEIPELEKECEDDVESEEGIGNEPKKKNTDLEKKEADKEIGETQKKKQKEKSGNDISANAIASCDPESIKQMAKEKLEKEMKEDKGKTFAELVIGYLLKRCEDDLGLAQDVVQKHKTWKKCLDYIYEQARKQAMGNKAAVRDEVVYEWAEDYYHKDDKAEEAEKAKKAAEAKKKAAERAAKARENTAIQEKQKSSSSVKKAEEKRTRRNNKDLEGQMDMFSVMGM